MNAKERFLIWLLSVIWINQHRTLGFPLQVSSNLKPSEFFVIVDDVQEFIFEYSVTPKCVINKTQCRVKVWVSDDYIVHLVSPNKYLLPPQSPNGQFKVLLEGILPGRLTLFIKLWQSDSDDGNSGKTYDYPIQIQRIETIADLMFTSAVILITAATNVGIGCEVDLDIITQQLKTPTAVLIGLCSQYLFMPLIAYAIVDNIDLMPGIKLGLFALGCSPGGSGSNAFAYLLGGDVSLSITMTLVSTVAALVLLPLWLFTLGKDIIQDEKIEIPFHVIVGALAGIIVPTALGVYIRRKHPNWAIHCIASIKYLMLSFILFCFTVGVWVNLFCFQLMRPKVLLASAFLPYTGFFLGGLTAFLLGRDKVSIITIAIETGIQNNGVPIVMMRLSMKGPERDTSLVGPVASGILIMIPFGIAVSYLLIRNYRALRRASGFTVDLEIKRSEETNLENRNQMESFEDNESLKSSKHNSFLQDGLMSPDHEKFTADESACIENLEERSSANDLEDDFGTPL